MTVQLLSLVSSRYGPSKWYSLATMYCYAPEAWPLSVSVVHLLAALSDSWT